MKTIELNETDYNCVVAHFAQTTVNSEMRDLVEWSAKTDAEFAEIYARCFGSNIVEFEAFLSAVSRLHSRIVAEVKVSSLVEVNYEVDGEYTDEDASEYVQENFSIADALSDAETDFAVRDMWVDTYRYMLRYDQYLALVAKAA